ncbi:hypothetical protein DFP72DRAFT_1177722 [Ephemerocybe angulata]|uniref:Uncharacterized protein n=1 Tax=Ephemerocybe angulata TaxID=980116 RepID=A0A8H6HB38_9AGAR|nr:hypothetical protein DFP72DRAFT_1177722 [Tulosesus angulatus]
MARCASTAYTSSSLTSHSASPTPPGSCRALKRPTPTWVPRLQLYHLPTRESLSFGLGSTRTPLESPVVGSFPTSLITGSSIGRGIGTQVHRRVSRAGLGVLNPFRVCARRAHPLSQPLRRQRFLRLQ